MIIYIITALNERERERENECVYVLFKANNVYVGNQEEKKLHILARSCVENARERERKIEK
jgi:hypothetical protein